jgi:hypothetical protein
MVSSASRSRSRSRSRKNLYNGLNAHKYNIKTTHQHQRTRNARSTANAEKRRAHEEKRSALANLLTKAEQDATKRTANPEWIEQQILNWEFPFTRPRRGAITSRSGSRSSSRSGSRNRFTKKNRR